MQAVVFGAYTDDIVMSGIQTRFDTDECFGTVINRFIVQALLKEPLTIYGQGNHKRGFISLNDSIQALTIAIENKPAAGKTRVWNQLSEWHSINDIAQMVANVAKKFNIEVTTQNLESLRHEDTNDHYYNYICEILPSLGYKPTRTIEQEIEYCINLLKDQDLSDLKSVIIPKIKF
jgi:nucleoside-diphosphate-sugar epimerase